MKRLFTLPLLAASMAAMAQTTTVVTFEDAQLTGGTLIGTSYEESAFVFDNYYYDAWAYNSGFTVSSMVDMETAGAGNQYSVHAQAGADGSKQFVIFNPCYTYAKCGIHRADNKPFAPTSVAAALTTYTYLSTRDGDAYAKKFGEGDHFTMQVYGMGENGDTLSTLEVKLIDYPTYWTAWDKIDLSPLGTVNEVLIDFVSSDMGAWGMNTPGYVALDNFTAQEADVTDAIATVAASQARPAIYNISGQRLDGIKRPGLYIMGGKKVVVK